MFITCKDKIDEVYDSLQADFNIEEDGEVNKYLGIDLDRRPSDSALPNSKDSQHDFRNGQVKR